MRKKRKKNKELRDKNQEKKNGRRKEREVKKRKKTQEKIITRKKARHINGPSKKDVLYRNKSQNASLSDIASTGSVRTCRHR